MNDTREPAPVPAREANGTQTATAEAPDWRQSLTCSAAPLPPTLADVLALAAAGLPLIPCAPRTKQPALGLDDWPALATTDPETLTAWWDTYDRPSLGYVVQPNHVVLDIDPRHGGLTAWQTLLATYGDIPRTWRTWSGRQDGGFHLYFVAEVALVEPNAIELASGVEVFGPGHLVIVPPSLHRATGQPYRWDADSNPFTLWAPAAVPTWLLNLIRWIHASMRDGRRKCDSQKKFSRSSTVQSSDDALSLQGLTKVPSENSPPLNTLVNGEAQTSPPPTSPSYGTSLMALLNAPETLPDALTACGLPATLQPGDDFCCPFHEDTHPSATLLPAGEQSSTWGFYCHACRQYWTLTKCFKQRTSGNLLSLDHDTDGKGVTHQHNRLRLMWTTRLLDEAGVHRVPKPWGAPSLRPDDAPLLTAIWEAFLQCWRYRSATARTPADQGAAFPFTWTFIKDWLGPAWDVSDAAVKKAKRALIARGYLEADGKDKDRNTLWKLGRTALRRALKGAPTLAREADLLAIQAATVVPEPAAPTPACPEAREFSHNPRACVTCLQVRLLERRAQAGREGDLERPFG